MLDLVKKTLIDAVYPPRCLACDAATDAPHGLCPACWRETHLIAGAACHLCGVPLVGEAQPGDVCESCQRHPPSWDRGAAAMLYRGAGRRMVLALKHGDRLDLVKPLARWMASAGADVLRDADVVAAVPLHWKRLLRRQYNQSAELARAVGHLSQIRAMPDLLVRARATVPQEKMNRTQRLENQSGAFAIHPRRAELLRGKTVVMVDDVLTSGATLSACTEALRSAGAQKVNVLVLCRVAFEEMGPI